MSEISEEATNLIDNFEYAVEDAVSDYTMACGASQKHQARRNLEDYIAELELRLDVYNGNMYDVVVDENAKLEAQVVIANKRIAELEAENERFTVHSDIERQDDKSPNHTQIDTVVY